MHRSASRPALAGRGPAPPRPRSASKPRPRARHRPPAGRLALPSVGTALLVAAPGVPVARGVRHPLPLRERVARYGFLPGARRPRRSPFRRAAPGRHSPDRRARIRVGRRGRRMAGSEGAGDRGERGRKDQGLPAPDPDLARDRQRRDGRGAALGHLLPPVQRVHRVRSPRRRAGPRFRHHRQPAKERPGDVGPGDRELVAAVHGAGHRGGDGGHGALPASREHRRLRGFQDRLPRGAGALPSHRAPPSLWLEPLPRLRHDRRPSLPVLRSGRRTAASDGARAQRLGRGHAPALPFLRALPAPRRERRSGGRSGGGAEPERHPVGPGRVAHRGLAHRAFRHRLCAARRSERELHFEAAEGRIVDRETGSTWNLFGTATRGPLEGMRLDTVESGVHFAFAWLAFNPDSEIWRAPH